MDRSSVCQLVTTTYSQNAYGVQVPVEATRSVFCNIQSVTANEFFQGGQNGLKPEYRVTMFKYDYLGEPEVILNNVRYTIYRTYEGRDDTLELYVERRKGNQRG